MFVLLNSWFGRFVGTAGDQLIKGYGFLYFYSFLLFSVILIFKLVLSSGAVGSLFQVVLNATSGRL